MTKAIIEKASGIGVAERWKAQRLRDDKWVGERHGRDDEAIYDALAALPSTSATPEAVAEAIGNKSWSYLTCAGCGEYVLEAVAIEGPWSDRSPCFCRICVVRMAQAFDV